MFTLGCSQQTAIQVIPIGRNGLVMFEDVSVVAAQVQGQELLVAAQEKAAECTLSGKILACGDDRLDAQTGVSVEEGLLPEGAAIPEEAEPLSEVEAAKGGATLPDALVPVGCQIQDGWKRAA